MSSTYITQQGDMVDAIAWLNYGFVAGAAEAILAANPGLSSQPPVLPENLTIALPALAAVTPPAKPMINLWD
ncbi:MAG: tail protein X [Roseiarcus sp.]|jgi:phage tail protein X